MRYYAFISKVLSPDTVLVIIENNCHSMYNIIYKIDGYTFEKPTNKNSIVWAHYAYAMKAIKEKIENKMVEIIINKHNKHKIKIICENRTNLTDWVIRRRLGMPDFYKELFIIRRRL